ncbi:MAG: nucleotidyl transferase AbiEii/AbiGii toxin family protein [Chloroflexi bacterium]|nr:nucleotidyl transferase AbiEii/AbiGii toxin family protein [Ardenticatenaceae bacterium]MBL1128181.1 hypothetical protein [Chloroflexota bacterium]NOG34254.1 nucleotidyl transferase AbiEii/AbiGii toxin family protein [Chloroflexota bacterium]GIK56368.1 MAG: hypothetical protein BroJett015_20310 [Chloroflexota bacterium]
MQPQKPRQVSDYANQCLEALATSPWAGKISLGGAFGLMHYLEYRSTYDVDAWWAADATSKEREQIVLLLTQTLRPYGEVTTRQWGDVVSVELHIDRCKAFSFQIAARSTRLQPPVPSSWNGIHVDSLEDLVASKMVALVERGAPRDFLDIYTICQHELFTAVQCWRLWQQRQFQSGSSTDSDRARLAVQMHLVRIEQHRPLAGISDPKEQASARLVRNWFKSDFLEALHG